MASIDNLNDVADWVRQLESNDSRLHKESVIEKALAAARLGSESADRFLWSCHRAYNPFITYGVKKVPESEGITGASNRWDKFWSLCEHLQHRSLTGNDAKEAIDIVMKGFDSTEWNGICRRVLIKDLRCGISDKTINKIVKGTEYEVPVFSCQLATDSTGRPEMAGKKRLERKLDGVRVLVVIHSSSVTCCSRNGKVFENFKHIEQAIAKNVDVICSTLGISKEDGIVLDGEVMGKTFRDLMCQARRKTDADASDSVYHIFDYLPLRSFTEGHWNKQQGRRIADLEKLRGKLKFDVFDALRGTDCIDIMRGINVDLDTAEGHDVMDRFARDCVDQGFEGIMIKDMEAPYLCKRSSFWMKWKPVHDYDLKVVGVEEGTGKNVGRLGALICEGTDQGKQITVNVGSGFSDSEREEIWKDQSDVIGQTVVVLCDAITQNQNGTYSLRFPRFKTFREDK